MFRYLNSFLFYIINIYRVKGKVEKVSVVRYTNGIALFSENKEGLDEMLNKMQQVI